MAKEGRPPKMVDTTVKKLEEAFSLGCSDLEACVLAGISKQTLYNYQKDHPEFIDRKELLKETPILLARTSVINGLQENPDLALKYLERKKKDEFSLRNELTGKDGEKLEGNKIVFENFSDATKSK